MYRNIYLLTLMVFILALWACNIPGENSIVNKQMQPAAGSTERVLFDFSQNESLSEWRSVNDTVMGGISSSRIEQTESGNALFAGTVSLDNNGGFASIRGPSMQESIAGFKGIAVRLRGDGKKYKIGLRTDEMFDGVFHQAGFLSQNGAWQEVKIPFTDFVPTYHGRRLSDDKRIEPEEIKSVSFLIADKQKGPFRLEIDWIKAYR